MCQLAPGHYSFDADYAPHEIWFTLEAFADALVALQRCYRFDGILVNIPGLPAGLLDQIARIEETPGGEQLTWRNGEITFCPWNDNPYHMTAQGDPVPRVEPWKLELLTPLAEKMGRYEERLSGALAICCGRLRVDRLRQGSGETLTTALRFYYSGRSANEKPRI